MRRSLALLLLAWAVLPAPIPAHAEDENPVTEAAARFLRAFRTGDEAGQAEVAADGAVDPVDVAATLWVWRVADVALSKPEPVRLDVLRALARRAAGRPDAGDLGRVVEAHAALGAEALAGEDRRRVAWREARRLGAGSQQADAYVRLLGDPDTLPTTFLSASLLVRAAEAEEAAGRTEAAAARFAAAGRRGEALSWPRLAVAAWEQSARLCVSLADWRGAATALEHSASTLATMGQDRSLVVTLLNLSVARRRQGRVAAAHDAALRAEAVAARRGDPRAVRAARLSQASALLEAGDWSAGEPLLRGLVEEARAAGDAGGASSARLQLALLLQRTGRLAEALTLSEQEIDRLAPAGPSPVLAAALRNGAVICREIGLGERALDLHGRALAAYEALGDRAGVVASLLNLGAVASTLGRFDEARERYHAVLEAQRTGGEVREVAFARVNLARLELAAGRPQDALAACEEAVASLEAAGLPTPSGVLLALGEAHLGVGDEARALTVLAQAVEALEGTGSDAAVAADVLHRAALAYARSGRPAQALPLAERCLLLRRDAAEGFDPIEGATLGSRVADVAGFGVSLVALLRASGALGDVEAVDRAFRFAEWGRALALAEALALPGDARAQGLADDLREEDLASRTEERRARARLEKALARGTAADVEAARTALSSAVALREAVLARLHRAGGAGAAIAWPDPIDAPAARRLLAPDEALVIYQRSPDRLRAVVLRAAGGGMADLGPADDLDAEVEAWRRLASVPGAPEAALARRLGARLLDPLAPLLEGARTWIVAPDGVLAFLPLDALATGPSSRRAVERATVAMIPSTTVFAMLRRASRDRPAGTRVLALGDPSVPIAGTGRGGAFGFPEAEPLPASGEEARALAGLFPETARSLLLGRDASVAALRSALVVPGDPFRVVHLACHARLHPEHPRLSGLLLAGGEVLDLDDVHRLRVDADVVVLSGCETGHGRLLRSEGVLGLARGFFVAGARRVVASSWKVGDVSTLDLMRRFYAALAAGVAPAEALARAKREGIALGGQAAEPGRWAAFSLWGEPR